MPSIMPKRKLWHKSFGENCKFCITEESIAVAHYEYVKTFSSICSAKIPYRYICNSCGREVTGMIKLTGEKETKLRSRHAENLHLSETENTELEGEALDELRAKLYICRKRYNRGDYSMWRRLQSIGR